MKLTKDSIAQFGNLELLAKQVVEGFITGLHKSPFHGFSVEFAEHRLYNKGESTKHIDWKLFARTDKLFVKRYEEETNLRCQFMVDVSSSMHFPKDESRLNKLEFSAMAIASLIELLKKQRDAVGLSSFSNEFKLETPAKTNQAHQRYIYTELEKMLNKEHQLEGEPTQIVNAIHHFAEKIHKRSLVFIFSDMLDNDLMNTEEAFSALQHLRHKKHEVVLFHVLDKSKEQEFNYENRPTVFVDMETGEEVKLNPVQIKEEYQAKISDYQANLKLKCGQYQIDYVPTNIEEGVYPILLQYLIKRSKLT